MFPWLTLSARRGTRRGTLTGFKSRKDSTILIIVKRWCPYNEDRFLETLLNFKRLFLRFLKICIYNCSCTADARELRARARIRSGENHKLESRSVNSFIELCACIFFFFQREKSNVFRKSKFYSFLQYCLLLYS